MMDYPSMRKNTEKLATLRIVMKRHNIHAWIIPSSDPHNSEYTADYWTGRAWLSGFNGSAGTVVVLQKQAALWVDSRYFLQAKQELVGSCFELMQEGQPGVLSINEWLLETLAAGKVVGFDSKVMTLTKSRDLALALTKKGITLKTDIDLLDDVWTDRPAIPKKPVFLYSEQMAGKTLQEKLIEVRSEIHAKGADYFLVTSLDDIAWLFNLRGSDVPCNPVFLSYSLITTATVQLFIDDSRIKADACQALQNFSIEVLPYMNVTNKLAELAKTSLLIDPSTTCHWLINFIADSVNIIETISPIKYLKAIKNTVEIQRMSNCYQRDGIALVRFMRWLEDSIPSKTITEIMLDKKLQDYRAKFPEFQGPSFPTIAAYASNGAIIHYRAHEKTCLTIQPTGLLLVDSGGQYLDGTTDISRTFACGNMTDEEMKDYTIVLKCYINLARTRFLYDTHGIQLDMLARQPAWLEGQNYNHSTGHGVGYFLNVHEEGIHSISPTWSDEPLKAGMLMTNEPGMYRNGKHGIRIENVMLIEEDIETEFGKFYKLRDLTLAPIDTRPLVQRMLNTDERNWLNIYHNRVFAELAPQLDGYDLEWLKKATVAI